MEGAILYLFQLSILLLKITAYSSTAPELKMDFKQLLESEINSIKIFHKVAGSVVNISNIIKLQNLNNLNEAETESGIGSGVIWDTKGHIITNDHVVDGGKSFIIIFKDSKLQLRAKLIGADPIKDIAVLQLEKISAFLKPIPIGNSESLMVGQKALAIGCPLGLNHSLTTGTISAVNRKIKGFGGISIEGMIQTDASINPGNSGGALLDSKGRLIGINTILYNASGAGASAGLGFAIPIDLIKTIVPQLIKYGKIIRPSLGIIFLEDFYSMHLGILNGVMIKFIYPSEAAGKSE